MATAVAVTLGLPAMALIQPGSRTSIQAIDTSAPGRYPGSAYAAAPPDAVPSEAVDSTRNRPDLPARGRETAASTLGAEVRRLSDEADSVDRLWQALSEQCGGKPKPSQSQASFGREWFSLLEAEGQRALGQDEPQFTRSADCVDLQELIRESGRGIRQDLRRAIATARRARVDPGTEVGLLRWHLLELPPG